MPIIRSGIKTYYCIDDVVCGDVIDAVFANKLKSSIQAVANTGFLVCNFANGVTHGRVRPYNGWAPGSNIIRPYYFTKHMVEMGKQFDRYVLQFTAKLGDIGGGRSMRWASVHLQDQSGTPSQRLGEASIGPASLPFHFQAPAEQLVRIRIDYPIETYMLATLLPGQVGSFDIRTEINMWGSGTANITDNDYFAGIVDLNLKFYKSCP